MTRPSEPLMTRNYAIFLLSVTAVVLTAPFLERNDWQGWVALIVLIAATGTMAGMWLYRAAQNVLDWWRDDY